MNHSHASSVARLRRAFAFHPPSAAVLCGILWSATILGTGGGTPPGNGEIRPLPFECGVAVATCFSRGAVFDDGGTAYCSTKPSSTNGFVVGLMDVRNPAGNGAAPFSNWVPPMYHNELGAPQHQWRASNLGEVFGIALDQQSPPNIFVAATSIYPGDSYPSTGGPGAVYRLDGTTYQISKLIQFNDVGGVSLGNLCYNPVNQQVYVADLDHGWIRRVSLAGVELSQYDHGVAGRVSASMPAIPDTSGPGTLTNPGRRIFAVQYYNNRIYYSVWDTVTTAVPGPGANTVWSIGLQPNGDFATGPGAAQLEIGAAQLPWDPSPHLGVSPPNPASQVSVVTDIEFTRDGHLLTAERGICFQTPTNLTTFAHYSPAREFAPAGTGWTDLTAPQGMAIGNSTPAHNSEGGIDSDCDRTVYVTGDLYVQIPTYIYGVQILPTATSPFSASFLVDLDASTTFFDKSYLGDVDVRRCCDCLVFQEEQFQCTTQPGEFQWSFCITNTSTLTVGQLTFIDLPPGVTVSPPVLTLNPPLLPGQGLCTNVIVTVAKDVADPKLCFRIAAHTPTFEECCVVTKCLEVPSCCGLVTKESLQCDPVTGAFTWNATVSNQSGVPANYLIVVPDPAGCASVPNPVIALVPPLPSGQSTNLSISLVATNSPCPRACFRLSFHDANFVACCSFTHCLDLKCGGENHPPVVDCPPPVIELCDPEAGKNYTIGAGWMDPDGDPLTAIWKVNGQPVVTNTVAAGISASFTALTLTHNFPPGTHTVTLCVTDGHGAPVICDVTLHVGDHTPPTVTCPPDRIIEKWEMVLPDLTGQVEVSDRCSPRNQIKIVQEPPPGTVIGPGQTCIKFTVTDAAGNSTTCITCVTLVPVSMVPLAPGFFATPPSAPTNVTLRVTGDLAGTAQVDYFVNGAILGRGAAKEFFLAWPRVAAGTYEIHADAVSLAPASRRYRTSPVYFLVVGAAGGAPAEFRLEATVRAGRLMIRIPTTPNERCFVEAADTLQGDAWRVIQATVGDGTVHELEIDAAASHQFIRVRVE